MSFFSFVILEQSLDEQRWFIPDTSNTWTLEDLARKNPRKAQTIEKIGNDKDKNLYSILDFKN